MRRIPLACVLAAAVLTGTVAAGVALLCGRSILAACVILPLVTLAAVSFYCAVVNPDW